MKKAIALIILISIIVACSSEDDEMKNSYPKPKTTEPDEIVESYWKLLIWSDTTFNYKLDNPSFQFTTSELKTKLINKNNKLLNEKRINHYRNRNSIVKIEQETDSRVIVYCNEYDFQSDEKSSKYKYIIKLEEGKWLIDDIFEECYKCDGTGKVTDYSNYNFDRKIDCDVCNGTGWMNRLY